MSKVDREIKALLVKSRDPKHNMRALLQKVSANLVDATGVVVIVSRRTKVGKTEIHSSLDYQTTIAELETAKTFLIMERIEGEYEDEEGD